MSVTGSANHQRLCIGTAQFGMHYGIANKQGKISDKEGKKIINLAFANGVHTIDTAMGYGDSEETLGRIGVSGWQLITKLSKQTDDTKTVFHEVEKAVISSINKLKTTTLYAVLFHSPAQLLTENGDALYKALVRLKENGLIEKIGISVYSPDELDQLFSAFSFDIVQSPFNILDRRLSESGWLEKLADKNVEIHIRSVFLQGLLLMPHTERPIKFNQWNSLWDAFDGWVRQSRVSALQACLQHVLSYKEISKVIVGVDSLQNMREILNSANANTVTAPALLATNDINLLHPSLW